MSYETPLNVRASLVEALQLDLIGPCGSNGDLREVLPQPPSRWYLTGFLVPTHADEEQRCDPTCNDELDQAAEPAGIDDDDSPEKPAARRSYLPSSMGISVLVPKSVTGVEASEWLANQITSLFRRLYDHGLAKRAF